MVQWTFSINRIIELKTFIFEMEIVKSSSYFLILPMKFEPSLLFKAGIAKVKK